MDQLTFRTQTFYKIWLQCLIININKDNFKQKTSFFEALCSESQFYGAPSQFVEGAYFCHVPLNPLWSVTKSNQEPEGPFRLSWRLPPSTGVREKRMKYMSVKEKPHKYIFVIYWEYFQLVHYFEQLFFSCLVSCFFVLNGFWHLVHL